MVQNNQSTTPTADTATTHSDCKKERLDVDCCYRDVVNGIRSVYNETISENEAQEAADNLIGFLKTLLEIKMEVEGK